MNGYYLLVKAIQYLHHQMVSFHNPQSWSHRRLINWYNGLASEINPNNTPSQNGLLSSTNIQREV
jgi:hypothetical protein